MPTVHRFHAAIGLDELDLVRSGIATHRLGTRFDDWSADGDSWWHVFGDYGQQAGTVGFHRIWARARRSGRPAGKLPFHAYAAAARLAQADKFVHPAGDPSSLLSTYLYGLFLDPGRYREALDAWVDAQRIERKAGTLAGVERRADGGVEAIVLTDGARIEADLFVDCAGPSAPIHSALGGRFEEWSDHLPGNRLLLSATAEEPAAPSPADIATAIPNGWSWSASAPGGPRRILVFNDAIGEEEARGLQAGEAELVAIRPGRCAEPWTANVLAIGDSSVALDPMHGAGLHLAQTAIIRALELLPGLDCHPLELREYNRQTGQETLRVRDFLALHYLRSGRTAGPFWRPLSGRAAPASLAHSLQQFEARGRLPFYEEESFSIHSWAAALLGMGVLPTATDPAAAAIDPEEAETAMRRLAARLAELPKSLPDYADYLTRMKAPGRR